MQGANGLSVTLTISRTLQALAYLPGWENSPVVAAAYVVTTVQAATPTFTPAAATYSASQTVQVSSLTAGALIRYTTDGTVPTHTTGIELANGGTIFVDRTRTIKAIACSEGHRRFGRGDRASSR